MERGQQETTPVAEEPPLPAHEVQSTAFEALRHEVAMLRAAVAALQGSSISTDHEGWAARTGMPGGQGRPVALQPQRGPAEATQMPGLGLQADRSGDGIYIASDRAPGLSVESAQADAIVASSLGGHGVHTMGGGVSGGPGTSPRLCGLFAEGGNGDGLYATGAEAAVRGVSPTGYGASLAGGKAPLHLVPAQTVGHPTDGEHQCGTLVVDAEGTLWVCIADGRPGTWRRVVVQ